MKIAKGGLSGLIQFLMIESLLKMMKNVFYLTSKALFVLKMFKSCSLVRIASCFRAHSLVVSDLRLKTKGSWFELLAMCRGELSAVIARLMSKCL